MPDRPSADRRHGARSATRLLAHARRPELLAMLPLVLLAAYWLGGETALVLAAVAVPLIYLLAGLPGAAAGPRVPEARDAVTGLPLRDGLIRQLDETLAAGRHSGLATACLAVSLDEADLVARRLGHAGFNAILNQIGARLRGAVRAQDFVARLDGAVFALVLSPQARIDLEAALQLAARLQEACEAAISLDASAVHVTVSVGLCLPAGMPSADAAEVLEAAMAAMDDASHNGPGAIRAYSVELQRARADRAELRRSLAPALDTGEIQPWFQPQLSTDTGALTGFETLVRWVHPVRGVLAPGQFLPGAIEAGLSERVGEVMLAGALRALRDWDAAGLAVPQVAVNFAAEELRNPRLPERIRWELDRFGLEPCRLSVEILETVVAEAADDVIVQTISQIARMGCRIDLDDFGTGHASIANIRRFSVARIKIDRSFVARVDEDREQQRIVAAILSMAERLGVETLAEGVETTGEHALLAQLGCGHVQGFGIARPMPFDAATSWIRQHHDRAPVVLPTGKRTG